MFPMRFCPSLLLLDPVAVGSSHVLPLLCLCFNCWGPPEKQNQQGVCTRGGRFWIDSLMQFQRLPSPKSAGGPAGRDLWDM